MNENLKVDCDLSHAIINYLNALYRGKFAASNTLKQFSHRDYSQDDFSRLEKTIQTINRWQQDLWKRMPLVSSKWSMPETFEAKRAFDLLNDSKRDLAGDIAKYDDILAIEDNVRTGDEIQLIISGYVRFVYGKDNFLKGFIEYGRAFDRNDLVEEYSQYIQGSLKEIQIAGWLLKEFPKRSQLKPSYQIALADACYLLPHNLRMNIHDINQFLAIYNETFTYELGDFSHIEGQHWEKAGFTAKEAGYWHAFLFTPESANHWRSAGIYDPAVAGRWYYSGFTPESTQSWLVSGLTPEASGRWLKAGYTVDQAVEEHKIGNTIPK